MTAMGHHHFYSKRAHVISLWMDPRRDESVPLSRGTEMQKDMSTSLIDRTKAARYTLKLTTLIGRVEAAEMRSPDAPSDLTDLVYARSAPLRVFCIGKEVNWENPLVSRIVSCL